MGRLCVVALVVLAVTTGAYADFTHIVQQFNMGIGAPSGASTSGSASGTATLSGSGTYYSWAGWPTTAWQATGLSFNNPTVGIGAGPVNLSSTPNGSYSVEFETVKSTLQQGQFDALNINLKDGASWGIGNLNTLTLSSTGGIGGISLTLTASSATAITAETFLMTGPKTGTYASGAFPSITYSIAPSGTLSATAVGSSYTGNLYLPGVGNVNLGTVLSAPSGSVNAAKTLSGTMTLTELAGPYPKDVAVAVHADASAVSIPLSTSNSYYYNNFSGGTNPYYVLSLSYGYNANVSAGAHMDLYNTLVDVIPEPMTLAAFGVGGALLTLARRRRVR
jgi:hypothetical protein